MRYLKPSSVAETACPVLKQAQQTLAPRPNVPNILAILLFVLVEDKVCVPVQP